MIRALYSIYLEVLITVPTLPQITSMNFLKPHPFISNLLYCQLKVNPHFHDLSIQQFFCILAICLSMVVEMTLCTIFVLKQTSLSMIFPCLIPIPILGLTSNNMDFAHRVGGEHQWLR